MARRDADLRILARCTQLLPVSVGGSGGRLRLTPINERELRIHLLNPGGRYDLQKTLTIRPAQSQSPHIYPHTSSTPRTQRLD